jgi:predicted nucleic acid-binding protein
VKPVFADTSFYIALLQLRDPAHALALAARRLPRKVLTTEFVILELGNTFARAEDHADFLALVKGLRTNPLVTIVPLSSELLADGLRLMQARPDKDWSLTDCISFIVMNAVGCTEALTTDHHFEQAGFRALLR